MHVSRLLLATLRDNPADAEIVSHQLLIRGGFIRRIGSGIYAYLPLMWRVLRKINSIVKEEMDAIGAQETLLPQLQPAELWEKSGRWNSYTAIEGIMFHLRDRQGKELGLGPTHEEVATSLAKDLLKSYRQLPITIYQIQSKFRDEIRPRFGLMRGREFIMKDAYSFHADEKSLQLTYSEMDKAYKKIFLRCGLKALAVEADSGAIGGSASQEFMIASKTGEDLILTSTDRKYAANQEKAISIPKQVVPLEVQESSIIQTPNQSRIEELCKENNFDPSQIIKAIIMLAISEGRDLQPLLIILRGDQELNELKLLHAVRIQTGKNITQLSKVSPEDIESQGLQSWPLGFIGPHLDDSVLKNAKTWNQKFLRLVDHSAGSLKRFICGANKVNEHYLGATWKSLGGEPNCIDIRNAKSGDSCVHDPSQSLEERRGIEIGHIFQLGKKYSKSLNANFTTEIGTEEPFWMGCYGIGISRLAQAAVEQSNDEAGIIWPLSIAPYEVIVVVANMKDEEQKLLGEKVYKELKASRIDALFDDRTERAGVKFKDADLIGIPWRLVVGRDSKEGLVELSERSNKMTYTLPTNQAVKKLISEISKNKN